MKREPLSVLQWKKIRDRRAVEYGPLLETLNACKGLAGMSHELVLSVHNQLDDNDAPPASLHLTPTGLMIQDLSRQRQPVTDFAHCAGLFEFLQAEELKRYISDYQNDA
jgi:hypothetical protein